MTIDQTMSPTPFLPAYETLSVDIGRSGIAVVARRSTNLERRPSMTLIRLFGFVTLATLLLGAIAAAPGSSFTAFFDIPSFVLVICGTIALLMIACDMRDWGNAARVLVGPQKSLDPVTCLSAALFFAQASRAAIALGIVGHVMGMIIMLGQFDDPDALGPGMALSLISVLYGVALSEFLFVPLRAMAMKRAESPEEPSVSRVVPLLLLLFVVSTVGTFFILVVALMP